MKNFDDSIRERIAREGMHLQDRAEARFEGMLANVRVQPREKRTRRVAILVSAGAALCALLALCMLSPAQDLVKNGALPTEEPIILPLTQSGQPIMATPEVYTEASWNTDGEVRLWWRMKNETEEIWLIRCTAQLEGEAQTDGLIWLEPGAEYSEQNVWSRQGKTVLTAAYRGYRVTAAVLHWVEDGEATDQQSLMEDAFQNGALSLRAGEWLSGKAGPMELALPESYRSEHPNADAMDVYEQKGCITAGFSGEKTFALGNDGEEGK